MHQRNNWEILCWIIKKENLWKSYMDTNESLKGKTMKEGVASKFQLSLSRRKFNFLYKVKSQRYDPETEKWNRKSVSYGDKKMNLHNLSISDGKVTNFVNSLDIGVLHTIPGYCGVFRTVAALTSRIIDLHLKCVHLGKKLVWYNGSKNHFIFEFSDDGAPETQKESMCIGSLTCWNFGKRVRSRDYHYLIHMITAKEKDDAVSNLWKQYAEEMQILEGNTHYKRRAMHN